MLNYFAVQKEILSEVLSIEKKMTQLLNHWGWSGGVSGGGASSRYDKAVRNPKIYYLNYYH